MTDFMGLDTQLDEELMRRYVTGIGYVLSLVPVLSTLRSNHIIGGDNTGSFLLCMWC